MVLRTGKGTSTSTTRYGGSGHHNWNNTGDKAYLSNASGTGMDYFRLDQSRSGLQALLTPMKLRASLLVAVLLVTLMPVLNSESASAATITARSMLLKLTVRAESGSTTYSRTNFKHWIDANRDPHSGH